MGFSLSENEEKVVAAYGVLALQALKMSANKDYKIKDLKLEDFKNEIIDMCRTRQICTALDSCKKYIDEEKNLKEEEKK